VRWRRVVDGRGLTWGLQRAARQPSRGPGTCGTGHHGVTRHSCDVAAGIDFAGVAGIDNPRVSRLFANLLLIVAVLAQCSPMRVCDWSALLSGQSCHDSDVASERTETGGLVAETGWHDVGPVAGHENTCVCNTPKGSEDHGGGVPVAPNFAPFVAGPVLVFAPPCYRGFTGTGGYDAVPSGPNPPQHTPLLI
jgi:hypothetical protein